MQVGIMMPAYNTGEYILQAIRSIKNQTYNNWELIICDDGSTDDTLKIAQKEAEDDNRIFVLQHSTNLGCPTTRNTCLSRILNNPKNEIIARLDSDDVDDPTRIEKSVKFLQNNENFQLVTTKFSWLLPENKKKQMLQICGMDKKKFLGNKGGRPCSASVIAWSKVYKKVGGFNSKLLAGSDGEWMFRCLWHNFNWGFIDEDLYSQRRHPFQISKRLNHQQRQAHDQAHKKYGLDSSKKRI